MCSTSIIVGRHIAATAGHRSGHICESPSLGVRLGLLCMCAYSTCTPAAFKEELPLRAVWKLCRVSSKPDFFKRP